MAAFVQNIRRKALDIFGADAFHWLDRSYAVDWAVACTAWVIAGFIKDIAPFEREFDPHDPVISHKHHNNTIGGYMNLMVALLVPCAVVIIVGTLRVSAMEIHHGLLSLWSGSAFNELITEFLKNRVGRLRPDFLTRCKWSDELQACTGKAKDMLEGRRSFPSGHSSTAFAGMAFLSLFIAGLTHSWCFSQASPARSLSSTRLGRLFIALLPVGYATWVAVSRLEDYRHHKEDVIVGSILGISTATTCYLIYWPNPFTLSRTSVGRDTSRARIVYGQETSSRHGYDYELAGVEHAGEPV